MAENIEHFYFEYFSYFWLKTPIFQSINDLFGQWHDAGFQSVYYWQRRPPGNTNQLFFNFAKTPDTDMSVDTA